MSKKADLLNRFFAIIVIMSLFLVFTQKTIDHHRGIISSVDEGIRSRYRSGEAFPRSLYDFYMGFHNAVKGSIEWYYSFPPLIEYFDMAYYTYLRATGRNHYNGVTFLTDGRLMMDTLEHNTFIHERADAIVGLRDYLYDDGIPFLYVRVPSKLKDNSRLPGAYSENSIIANGDALHYVLMDYNVDTLDLREEMGKDEIDFATAFFRMDLHWTAETALWASGKIGAYINREYGFEVDESVWEPGRYERVTYKQAFNGNEINAVGGYHVFEDITALCPSFQTELEMLDRQFDILSSGSFIDVYVPKLKNAHNVLFSSGDTEIPERDLTRLVNMDTSNSINVLVISDSFGLSLATFFSLGFESVDVLYLITGHTHTIKWDVIDEEDYDLVIFVLSDAVISLENRPVFEDDRLFLGHPPD